MALSQVYTAIAGHVITAARWNNEFGNIYANGTDVAFPLTKAVSLAGFTLTLDGAGVTTVSSTSSQAFILTPGSKSGTPSINGNFFQVAAATFTDSNTAGSGTCAVWNGSTIRAPTLAASNTLVTTTDASTVHIEAGPTAGTNETLTGAWALSTGGNVKVGSNSSRTNTVDTPLVVESVTTGIPAAGIGTGILLRAESQDENPSDVGQIDFTFSDRTAASEDSYCQILLRVAGAALAAAYRFASTTAFRAIFTHANTADRTYTLPDFTARLVGGAIYNGPSSVGASSTQSHEGSVTISANQALDGIHYYTNFTLNASTTTTLDAGSHRVVIVATGTITINGTINASSAGSASVAGIADSNAVGNPGFSQPGAGGGGAGATAGGAAGGSALLHGVTKQLGGAGDPAGTSGIGTAGTQLSGDAMNLTDPFSVMGGASGGTGGGTGGGVGGASGIGGGSIVLIAPNIVLGVSAVLNTSGGAGAQGAASCGGGGGGGAGNVYIYCVSYTDNGCTFTLTGGAGAGANGGNSGDGGAGATGIRQINIYA